MLSHPLAWSSLTAEDRREIISLFPDKAQILEADTDAARPNFDILMSDDGFRADCAAYVANLAHGRHDPVWLAEAWTAHERRKAGDFDAFLKERFEEEWGPLPEPTLDEIHVGGSDAQQTVDEMDDIVLDEIVVAESDPPEHEGLMSPQGS